MRDQDLIKLMEVREKEMEQNLLQKAEAFGYLYKNTRRRSELPVDPTRSTGWRDLLLK